MTVSPAARAAASVVASPRAACTCPARIAWTIEDGLGMTLTVIVLKCCRDLSQ